MTTLAEIREMKAKLDLQMRAIDDRSPLELAPGYEADYELLDQQWHKLHRLEVSILDEQRKEALDAARKRGGSRSAKAENPQGSLF